jgi:GLPGLI family protein
MKFRYFLIIVAFAVSGRCFGQTHYEVTYANDGVYEPASKYAANVILRRYRQRLLFTDKVSFFYTLWNDSDPLKKKIIDSFDLNHSTYYDAANAMIYTLKILPKDVGTLLVANSLAEEDWIFTNQTKKIKGYNCRLVSKPIDARDTIFVWYTEEIPFAFGPGYYVGFPGLVLQVEDMFNKTRISVTEIKEKPVVVNLPQYRIISRKEFHDLYE